MECRVCGAPLGRSRRPQAPGTPRSCSQSCANAGNTRGYKHGHNSPTNRSPTYVSWHAMRQRCQNPNQRGFPNYGGRGITVCERWQGFVLFLEDMGVRPDNTSIDRIDTNGNYEPSNCRWSTPKAQMQNMRKNRIVEYYGESVTLQELADRLSIDRYTLRRRILDMKWPQERWADRPLPRSNQSSRRELPATPQ